MKLTHLGKWMVLGCLVSVSLCAAAADTLFVQSAKATIFAAPKFGQAEVAQLMKGTELTALEKNGTWYKVQYQEKVGWISALVIGNHPPMDKVTVLTGDEQNIKTVARRRSSGATTAGATRGLAADDRSRENDLAGNFRALRKLEGMTAVESTELEAFIAAGYDKPKLQ